MSALAASKILIVEDEGIVAFNLQQRLQHMGYRITGLAESGAEGLALVSRERPDLVLMDIHLKGEMDGIELASALNRDFELPIVYLTAYSEDATLERARSTRPYGYLIKPFSERELHATVQMALERHAVQAALSESQAQLRRALDAATQGQLELQRVNEALEERVMERTAELRQHVRELEAFSHTAAHDLRSPVRAVSGLSQILIDTHGERLGDDGREMLDRLANAARRMGELIEALLRLSKLSSSTLRRSDVNLSEIAHEVAGFMRSGEPQREVRIDIAPNLRVQADPVLIRSVIDNLLRNAWKFTRDSPQPHITLHLLQQDGRSVYAVRDNGCGFQPDQAHKLFGAFFRLHAEHDYGGSGLGLSIAQRIVQRHGGEIWAEGEPGRGATVYFTLGG